MHLLDNLDGVLLDERLVGEDLLLLVEAGEVRGGHDVRDGAEAMEEHGDELDEDDGEEEEYQYDTDRLEVQVLFRDDDLRRKQEWELYDYEQIVKITVRIGYMVLGCMVRSVMYTVGRPVIRNVLKITIWGVPRPAWAVGSYSSAPPARGTSQTLIFKT